jgi:endonuclease/exonuclease/phosphatase family metal-dependent hydrolase
MAIIPFIAIVIGFPLLFRLIPLQGYFNTSNPEASDLKILSYNVRLFGLYNWQERNEIKQEMFDFIEPIEADVACFQEYFWSTNSFFPTTDVLIQLLNTPYHYQASSLDPVQTQYFGISTFSKYPIVNSGSIKFERTHNLIIYTDILYCNDTLRIYNCHLQSMYFSEENYQEINDLNLEQIKSSKIKGVFPLIKKFSQSSVKRSIQVRTLAKHIKECDYPVIVCGDFNDNPYSYTYKIVKSGLKDSYSNASKKPGYTWEKGPITQRIDFMFYPKSYFCTSHKVIHVNYSDHYPIVATFRKIKQ